MRQKGHLFRWPGLLLLFVLLVPLLAACGEGDQSNQPKPTPNPEFQRVAYDIGLPPEAKKAPVVGDVPADTPIDITVMFKTDDKVLDEIGGDGKGKPGDSVDLDKEAKKLGISDEDYALVKQYFGVDNATLELGKLHTTLKVKTKTGSLGNLLQTKFVYRELNGKKFFAPEKDPMIPKFILDRVVAITGLEDFSQAPQKSASLKQFKPLSAKQLQKNQAGCDVPPEIVNWNTVAGAYGLAGFYQNGWTGKGVTIYLPEFEPFNPDDVRPYLDCVGYRGKLTVTTVGPAPDHESSHDADYGFETVMDIEMIAGLAPDADIKVYQSRNTGYAMANVLNQISEDSEQDKNIQMVSLSWGSAEAQVVQSQIDAETEAIRTLTQVNHMSVFVISGDCGAYGSMSKYDKLDVIFPASVPWAIAVGGTQLTSNGNGRASEVTWRDPNPDPAACKNTWGSGGGLSTLFDRPKWQQGAGVQNKQSNGSRQLPDVAAAATNLAIHYHGQWYTGFGTSAATPIWAATFAVINQALAHNTGYFFYGPSTLYQAASKSGGDPAFYDIVEGDNLYYKAGPGWDFTTGLGSPNTSRLYDVLTAMLKDMKK
ncbi:subtilase family protein [Thermosporothrix hazakensis]|uniref:Subtilase family protein n=2 Tax=Thermosporothrix TaxID=768650 RepID=A0A326U5R9_THEHA|nr:S53 family peptidase [Thermosporothrix hazakensis]PZW27372.1 subtilase family protein [Thermosporothrix hazakensis]BBH86034.1 pseudomonapepsin [Thermosporothrix sp. COM3]GCE45541.1 pseudomonapepsin [Thermosporothrix hazakensis]